MKSRLTLLVLAAALLIAPLASHAEPLASTAPAACAANASTSQLPGFNTSASNALLKTIMLPKCGSCSGSPCAGAGIGSICGVGGGGQYKFCADLGNCPLDGLTQCRCQTGPPF